MVDWANAIPRALSGVQIESAVVPEALDAITAHGVLWQAGPGRFRLEVPGLARYLVTDGCSIRIEPSPLADPLNVTRILRMTPLAALLYQRGMAAFHAAAIASPGGAVLLAGDSGAGKSTLLAAMLNRGWNLLSDDLAIARIDECGRLMVFPTFPEIALWPDSAAHVPKDAGSSSSHKGGPTARLTIALESRFATEPSPLRAVYWLSIHSGDNVETSGMAGAERYSAIHFLSYNSRIAGALLDRTRHFHLSTAIGRSVEVRRLKRPRGRWSLDRMADIIDGERTATQ